MGPAEATSYRQKAGAMLLATLAAPKVSFVPEGAPVLLAYMNAPATSGVHVLWKYVVAAPPGGPMAKVP